MNEQGQQAAADVSLDATLDTMLAEMDAEDTAAAAEEVPAGPNPFEALGLAPELVRAVTDMGYTQPTPYRHRPFLWPWAKVPMLMAIST